MRDSNGGNRGECLGRSDAMKARDLPPMDRRVLLLAISRAEMRGVRRDEQHEEEQLGSPRSERALYLKQPCPCSSPHL